MNKQIEILEGIKNCYNKMLQEAKPENRSVVRKWIYQTNLKIVAHQGLLYSYKDSKKNQRSL